MLFVMGLHPPTMAIDLDIIGYVILCRISLMIMCHIMKEYMTTDSAEWQETQELRNLYDNAQEFLISTS